MVDYVEKSSVPGWELDVSTFHSFQRNPNVSGTRLMFIFKPGLLIFFEAVKGLKTVNVELGQNILVNCDLPGFTPSTEFCSAKDLQKSNFNLQTLTHSSMKTPVMGSCLDKFGQNPFLVKVQEGVQRGCRSSTYTMVEFTQLSTVL
ncbi:hypothetical protein NFI96_007295 [Prochilodus magdalenae]|nr:hypothetical protein NFI96_007295 [Prochilodus magdalenae]